MVELRQWTHADLPLLVAYANNRNIYNNMTDAFPHPYTEADGLRFIDRALADLPAKLFAIQLEGELVGSIGLFPETDIYRTNAAIAYWVAEPFHGKGIATDAIRLMVKYGFETFDINRIYAKPFSRNKASHQVLEKAGFVLEAILEKTVLKNDEFLDEHIYAIRRNSPKG